MLYHTILLYCTAITAYLDVVLRGVKREVAHEDRGGGRIWAALCRGEEAEQRGLVARVFFELLELRAQRRVLLGEQPDRVHLQCESGC